MRGKLLHRSQSPNVLRITPADAGKTVAFKNASPRRKHHPRGCGENGDSTSLTDVQKRITPADAGKTVKSLYGSR